MKNDTFQELLGSVREAGRISRGEARPVRVTAIVVPDVKAIRERYGMSQDSFAAMLGISRRTLEGWEQGRRQPTGPARRLLQIADRFPEAMHQLVAG